MSILEKLGRNGNRVFSVNLNDDKTSVEFIEECDVWFGANLNKSEMAELIDELTEIKNSMVKS